MPKGYTHEGTPLIVSHELMVYHTGTTILTMFNPRTNKWDAQKYWGGMKLLDDKTEFTTEGFMMFNWNEIVSKGIVVSDNFNVSSIDLEQTKLHSQYANAILSFHDFHVNKETVKNYKPIKIQFDTQSVSDVYMQGLELSVPYRWNESFSIRKFEITADHLKGRIQVYDPDLEEQVWHQSSMANIKRAMELYQAAIPNIPVRHRKKKGEI